MISLNKNDLSYSWDFSQQTAERLFVQAVLVKDLKIGPILFGCHFTIFFKLWLLFLIYCAMID